MDSGDVESSGAVDFVPDTNPVAESGGAVESNNSAEVIPVEDMHFHSSNITRVDSSEYFDKPEDRERKKKEEQKRMRVEAKRIVKEERRRKRQEARSAKPQKEHVPMSSKKKTILIASFAAFLLLGSGAGLVYMYNTYWKPKEPVVLSEEEREEALNSVASYYSDETDEKIAKDANKIYKYLGEKYEAYEDEEIRLACLYRKLELLSEIDGFAEKLLDDARKADEIDQSINSAGWLKKLYSILGDEKNVAKYEGIIQERAKNMEDDSNGEG